MAVLTTRATIDMTQVIVWLLVMAALSLLRMTSVPERYQTVALLVAMGYLIASELWTGEATSIGLDVSRRKTDPAGYWFDVTLKAGVGIILLVLLIMDLRGLS